MTKFKTADGLEVEIADRKTRKVTRGFNQIIGKGTSLDAKTGNTTATMEFAEEARDYLVVALTNLDQSQVDNLTDEDFEAIYLLIENINIAPTKAS
jgi:hypothetical protein